MCTILKEDTVTLRAPSHEVLQAGKVYHWSVQWRLTNLQDELGEIAH